MTDSGEQNKPVEVERNLDPEELLLAMLASGDRNETQIELLREEMKKSQQFRLRGSREADGTITAILTDRNIPVRINSGLDIAVGPRQIQRQIQKEQQPKQ